jgi:type I restriction enzyme S subunit
LEDQATGTTMNNLSNKTLAELRIRLPSKAKQESIIEMLRGLSQQTSNLESIYQQKLATLSELKQSLLRKAFSGELTAEDRNVKEAAA